MHCVQVVRILPESVLYGRHLLREGDYITSVNGESLKHLSSAECDQLLVQPSTVVCIELLRKTDLKTSLDGRTDTESNSKSLETEVLMAEDDQMEKRYESSALRRHSSQNELNQNELFARSKLRLSYCSEFDRHRSIHKHDHEHSYQTLCGRKVFNSGGSISPAGRDLARRRLQYVKETYSGSDAYIDVLELPNYAPVSCNPVKNSSELSKIPRVVERSPTTPVHNLHRRTTKQSKGVRFKLLTEDKNTKEKNDEEQDQLSSADRPLLPEKRHEVTATAIPFVKSSPDSTENICCPRYIVSQRLGTTSRIILTTSDHQDNSHLNQKNRAIEPSTSAAVKQYNDLSTASDAVDSPAVVTTTASSRIYRRQIIPSVQSVLDQQLLADSNAHPSKIYSSVISLGSNGSVVLTTRVTPSTYYQPFLPLRRNVSRPFQINVVQGLTGLGIEVAVVPSGTIITRIVDTGPVGRNGNVR